MGPPDAVRSLTRLGLPRKHRTCRRFRLRARSARLGRSKWPLELTRLRQGARNGCSNSLELARTRSAPPGRSKLLGLAARKHRTCQRFRVRGRSAPLGRSTLALEPARLRWGARNRRSSPLGSAGPETLHWAGPRMPVALNTETNILVHGMHGYALVYIYIYIYMYYIMYKVILIQD